MIRIAAIVAAAGAGLRMGKEMGSAGRKQYLELEGSPVLARSLNLFLDYGGVEEIIAVIPAGEKEQVRELLQPHCSLARVTFIDGGAERQDSVQRGLKAVGEEIELVCIHDAARPLASPALLERLLQAAEERGAAVPVIALSDTVKEIDSNGYVTATPQRDKLRLVQTPQVFRCELIRRAYHSAGERGLKLTDDSALVEELGEAVVTVEGELSNLKITTPRDLALAALMLKEAGK